MAGTLFFDRAVVGGLWNDGLEDFLQSALRIQRLVIRLQRSPEWLEDPCAEFLGGRPSAVEVDCADDGLHGVGQIGGSTAPVVGLFAPAHDEVAAEIELHRKVPHDLSIDQAGPALGEIALVGGGMRVK